MEKLLCILCIIPSLWQWLGLIKTTLCSLCMSSRTRMRRIVLLYISPWRATLHWERSVILLISMLFGVFLYTSLLFDLILCLSCRWVSYFFIYVFDINFLLDLYCPSLIHKCSPYCILGCSTAICMWEQFLFDLLQQCTDTRLLGRMLHGMQMVWSWGEVFIH